MAVAEPSTARTRRERWVGYGLMFRIKMQHRSCDFTPVSPFRVCVEHAQMRHEMFLVASGQRDRTARYRRQWHQMEASALTSSQRILVINCTLDSLAY